MQTALLVLIAAVAVSLIVWLVGRAIPRGHRVTRSISLQQPQERVWQVITDYDAQPSWHPDIEEVERIDTDSAWQHWRVTYSRDVVTEFRVAESDPPNRISWEFEEEHGLFRARWDAHLLPDGQSTTLVITQQLDLRSPWARVIGIFVRRTSSLKLYLGALATHLQEPQSVQRTRAR